MKRNLLVYISLSFLFFYGAITPLSAHSPNQSILFLQIHEHDISGRFEVAIKDLNKFLPNSPLKQGLNEDDLQPYKQLIESYLLEHASISNPTGQALQMAITGSNVYPVTKNLGDYIQVHFDLKGFEQVPTALKINYNLLFEKDPNHQGAAVIEENSKLGISNNERVIALIFTSDDATQLLGLNERYFWQSTKVMLKLGIKHILIGLDHILFLLALILPAVLTRKRIADVTPITNPGRIVQSLSPRITEWFTLNQFKPALFNILKIITFFTLAHSITLSLAALEVVLLPSKLVETIIAFSIALAAYHNIRPIFKAKEWMIAFIFGLFHGFGFASVLSDYGMDSFLVSSLLGFNLGVEVGQLFIMAFLFPIIFLLRKSRLFPKLLVYGSVLLIIIAFYWVIGRVFELDLPGDDIVVQVYRFFKSLFS